MARYVLLRFEDNNDAEAFVTAAKAPNGVWFYESNPDAHALAVVEGNQDLYVMRPLDRAKVLVRGLFAIPTKFCECELRGDKGVRGAKLGWWLCRGCKKPRKGHWQKPKNLLVDGPQWPRANLELFFTSGSDTSDEPREI